MNLHGMSGNRWRSLSVITATAITAGLAGVVGPSAAQPSTPAISLVSLAPKVVEAGLPYVATLVVNSTGSIAVQEITVAVRTSSGAKVDFPGAHSATIDGTYVYTSEAETFAAGAYTAFGSYETDNVWHPLPSQTLTVIAAPSSSNPNPAPVGIPGTWTSSLNDGPAYADGTAVDNVSSLTHWDGANGSALTAPHNPYEDACYNPANVKQDGSFVDLSLTQPARSACAPPSSYDPEPDYGAQVDTDGGIFQQQYGAFEADVYLPPAPDGTIADWPAFWLLGTGSWPLTGEIDAVEGLCGRAWYHFHYGATGPGSSAGGSSAIGPGWHTFGVSWQPIQDGSYPEYLIAYYYDGIKVGTLEAPDSARDLSASPMTLMLDISHNSKCSSPALPATMQVAYVRAWTGPPVNPVRFNAPVVPGPACPFVPLAAAGCHLPAIRSTSAARCCTGELDTRASVDGTMISHDTSRPRPPPSACPSRRGRLSADHHDTRASKLSEATPLATSLA